MDLPKITHFPAIIFALGYSNELNSLPNEFHDFNGSVELIFNIDQNVAIGKFLGDTQIGDKISLRRTIRQQQIEYFLNGVGVERLDVKHFLDIFGFSASYPFQYSMASNDIATVELSNDKDRLNWLKDCCGIDEFCKKRDKSMRIVKETKLEIQKIDASLVKIDVQLNIFASNEQQKIYQNWVKREQELGHFKRLYRIKHLRADIEKRKIDINRQINLIDSNKAALIENVEKSKEVRRQIKLLADKVNVLRTTENQLKIQIAECEQANSTLEGLIVNLENAVEQSALAEDLSIQEKHIYCEKMDQTQSKIDDIDIEIERVAEEIRKIEQQVNELDSQAAMLRMNCQQNQRLNTQFSTATKRNEHLSMLIKRAKNAIIRENRNLNKLQQEIQQGVEEMNGLKTVLSARNEQIAELNDKDETQSFHQQQEMYNGLENHRW